MFNENTYNYLPYTDEEIKTKESEKSSVKYFVKFLKYPYYIRDFEDVTPK